MKLVVGALAVVSALFVITALLFASALGAMSTGDVYFRE